MAVGTTTVAVAYWVHGVSLTVPSARTSGPAWKSATSEEAALSHFTLT